MRAPPVIGTHRGKIKEQHDEPSILKVTVCGKYPAINRADSRGNRGNEWLRDCEGNRFQWRGTKSLRSEDRNGLHAAVFKNLEIFFLEVRNGTTSLVLYRDV